MVRQPAHSGHGGVQHHRGWKRVAAPMAAAGCVGLCVHELYARRVFLVPWLAKSYIESYVREDLGRQVTIGELTFNPFTFAADVRSFSLNETDGSLIASFDLLRIDFSLSSIFNSAWTFAEVRLDAPQMRVLIAADGSLNLGSGLID